MKDKGLAHMGIGNASGETRAVDAARQAIQSPLLETSIKGAKGVLLNVTGGSNLGLFEVNEASTLVMESCDPEANVIFGASIKEDLGDEIMITVIATGFEGIRDDIIESKPKKSSVRSSLDTTIKSSIRDIDEDEEISEKLGDAKNTDIVEDDSMEIPTFLRRRR